MKTPITYRALLGATFLVLSAVSSGVSLDAARAQGSATVAKPLVKSIAPTLRASIFKVVRDANGRESFVSAEKVRPGDLVEYRVVLTNSSTRNLSRVQANLPIPAPLVFVGDSARPLGALASTDGVVYGAMPLKRRVRFADGTTKTVPVPYAEYRALRWTVGNLAAGRSFQARARARVRSVGAPAAVTATSSSATSSSVISKGGQ